MLYSCLNNVNVSKISSTEEKESDLYNFIYKKLYNYNRLVCSNVVKVDFNKRKVKLKNDSKYDKKLLIQFICKHLELNEDIIQNFF
ncbi:MAG: hypothetical protein ACK4OM_00795 [Alphaproteobacteria bacterium]